MAKPASYWREDLECMNRDLLGQHQMDKLRGQLRHVYANSPFYRRKLDGAGIAPDDIRTMRDFERIPFTEKEELCQAQRDCPPWGDVGCITREQSVRIFRTSGTTGEPVKVMLSHRDWFVNYPEQFQHFRCGYGLTPRDVLYVPFNYGMYIAWWGFQAAMEHAGLTIIPGGGLRTPERLSEMLYWGATAICGTPSYLLHLAEIARQTGVDLVNSPIVKMVVAGEPGANVPATRRALEKGWGAEVFDDIGSTEIGNFGFECQEHAGTHVIESMYIAESLDRETQEPVADGEIGELVLTNLVCESMPLIRYRTHDLVRFDRSRCACGRAGVRLIGGVVGRSDDMFQYAGVNVFPTQIEEQLRCIDEFSCEYQLVIPKIGSGRHLIIRVEPASSKPKMAQLVEAQERLVRMIRERVTITPQIDIVQPGGLPRFEGKAKRIIRE
ncbi:MAG: AMP-binding protein [Rhodobacteraceae bacterium]|nr:AMP-binding protein [Paracoccaceae bacterium]